MGTDIRACALEMERIDTHGHLGAVPNDLAEAAMGCDRMATGAEMMNARVAAEGCRKLYGIDPGVFLQSAAPPELFAKAAALRSGGWLRALERAFDVAGIERQLVFTSFRPEACDLRELFPRVQILAYIDEAIAGTHTSFCPDFDRDMPDFCLYDQLCEHFGELDTIDDFLGALDEAVDGWRSGGVVGMKTAFAYTIGLAFADPPLSEARAAFARKGGMTRGNIRTVCDYAFRHSLLACTRNELPVVIHTGFQIWGHASLAQSNPMHLHNLLVDDRYRELTFVLLHGGNPYVGETTYLASMFPNVVIDFTWISWMTRLRFRQALGEWLEVVPHDRICWGSDSGSPESIVGIDSIVRGEIAGVLEGLMQDGIMDEKTSLAFLENCYQKTPRRVFGL